MEACNLRCCSSERDLDPAEPYSGDVIENGMKKSLRTVVVISPDFLNKTWILVERLFANNEALVVRLQKCDLPASLADFRCIDAVFEKDWWWKLVKAICTGCKYSMVAQIASHTKSIRKTILRVNCNSISSFYNKEIERNRGNERFKETKAEK